MQLWKVNSNPVYSLLQYENGLSIPILSNIFQIKDIRDTRNLQNSKLIIKVLSIRGY